MLKIAVMGDVKKVSSPNYNYLFHMKTGQFVRWGSTRDENPKQSPAPEIADIEISSGDCIGCKYCYKSNSPGKESHHMTLNEFKIILSKFPRVLCQIAFGITNINSNPDFFPIMEWSRSQGVIPNYTCNGFGVTEEVAKKTAELCGAVAVSVHNEEAAFNAIEKFCSAGMTQVNIHYVLSQETYDRAIKLIDSVISDDRLKKLNAIVFLRYKPKGTDPKQFNQVTLEQYKALIHYCDLNKVNYGFDSCSAPVVLKAYEGTDKHSDIMKVAESCESSCFSSYINSKGDYYPCSFTENEAGWETGLSVLNCDDFVKDIWNHPKTLSFREKLLNSSSSCGGCASQSECRLCPVFDLPCGGCSK